MKYNIFNIVLLILITMIQILIPMGENGRTYYSYFLPWFSIIFKTCFILKLFGLPISIKFIFCGEIGIYFFTMFFFLSALYKKQFEISIFGITINILCTLIILILFLIENSIFVYEHIEKKEH